MTWGLQLRLKVLKPPESRLDYCWISNCWIYDSNRFRILVIMWDTYARCAAATEIGKVVRICSSYASVIVLWVSAQVGRV